MDNVVPTFPVLRLPINAILKAFRNMNLVQIFGISILSKKTKRHVESLKLTDMSFEVQVTDCFKVTVLVPERRMLYIQLLQVLENQPLQELGTPESLNIGNEQTWTNLMSVKELLDHLKCIFHTSITTLYFDTHCERFSLDSIHRNVKDVGNICIFSGNHEYNRRILSLFQPPSLNLADEALVDGRVPRDVLIQNFDAIHVPNGQITLDDFLMTNSRFIHFFCRELSTKTLNKILKLWVKGAHPRLECLFLQFPGDLRLEELFSGLKYKNAPRRRVRLFKTSSEKNPQKVHEGWDISRFDGTRATVLVRMNGDFVRFYMFVWHDHCAVNSP